jgi:hypothetical protein
MVGFALYLFRGAAFHVGFFFVVFFLVVVFFVLGVHRLVLRVRLGIDSPPFDMRVNVFKPERLVWLIIFLIDTNQIYFSYKGENQRKTRRRCPGFQQRRITPFGILRIYPEFLLASYLSDCEIRFILFAPPRGRRQWSFPMMDLT